MLPFSLNEWISPKTLSGGSSKQYLWGFPQEFLVEFPQKILQGILQNFLRTPPETRSEDSRNPEIPSNRNSFRGLFQIPYEDFYWNSFISSIKNFWKGLDWNSSLYFSWGLTQECNLGISREATEDFGKELISLESLEKSSFSKSARFCIIIL